MFQLSPSVWAFLLSTSQRLSREAMVEIHPQHGVRVADISV